MDAASVIVAIVTALITSGATLTVCIINNIAQNNKQKANIDKIVSLLEYKLEVLTERVESSATVNEKVARLESLSLLMDERLNDVIRRLEKLEES